MDATGPLNYLPLYFMHIITTVMQLQYAIIVYNVGQRFVRVNKSLENVFSMEILVTTSSI